MTTQTTPIAQTNEFIILNQYTPIEQMSHYQTEQELEKELIADLSSQGFEYRPDLNNQDKLLANIREQLEQLNKITFSDGEWQRLVVEYLDKASENIVDKAQKLHHNHIYDFVFDTGRIQNIMLLDKKIISNNKVQVINQFEQTGTHKNRYDVTILVNGLPLVHIELKKRGEPLINAFHQIHRYGKESFNSEYSLFKYVQIFVISNGTDTRYFANTIKRDKNSFDFTMNWATVDNKNIHDLKDFTATFFNKNTLLSILIKYSVLDINNNLLLMRPYQIAGTERILWKINSSYLSKNWSNNESGGFIWHTTGSGKTLTSFKSAQLTTQIDFIDKVLFVVDRKDLDYQTVKEYQRFSPDSVNGSDNTAGLKRNLANDDNKIVVTTIQKLNNLLKTEEDLEVYQKQVVLIFDECHRSQFGEAQKNIQKKFKKYYQFGFTGTPIFPDNSLNGETTADVFGRELHAYTITDAIRDEKVLKFKVDYHNISPKFKTAETENDLDKLSAFENKETLLHPERIKQISQYILDNFKRKTGRNNPEGKGFNAMFAVSSVESAKLYYETLKALQQNLEKPLKIATIFSYSANESQEGIGSIEDENFEPNALNSTAKEFLMLAIKDYNAHFRTNFSVDGHEFQNYYRDLQDKIRKQEVDLVIVVGMLLTGFDAPALNTLFVDKNLRYHGLIQAYSRTNRIYNATKAFGNIVCFRDLEQATIDAIKLFGNNNTRQVILEKKFDEQLAGFTDVISGKENKGFLAIIQELADKFPSKESIETESDKKAFAKVFGDYLKAENILKNYDEYKALEEMQTLDKNNADDVQAFKNKHQLYDKTFEVIKDIVIPTPRQIQDYRSAYNDICEWSKKQKEAENKEKSNIDWSDVVFEIDLLKTQEINLDYILALLFEEYTRTQNKEALIAEIQRTVRASLNHRAKEPLIVDFIEQADLGAFTSKSQMIDEFYAYAKTILVQEMDELIEKENLQGEKARRYLDYSLRKEYANEHGTSFSDILPKKSRLNPNYSTDKQSIFAKIVAFIDKFKGIGKMGE